MGVLAWSVTVDELTTLSCCLLSQLPCVGDQEAKTSLFTVLIQRIHRRNRREKERRYLATEKKRWGFGIDSCFRRNDRVGRGWCEIAAVVSLPRDDNDVE